MSPSEFQLRAALHDGEGDAPDPDRLIAHAVGVRRERRRRINVAMGGAAAVALVGLCAGVIIANRGSGDSGASADRAALPAAGAGASSVAGGTSAAASASSVAGGAASVPGSTTSSGTSFIGSQCPAQPDRFMVPGGGGIGRFGSTEPLFEANVVSLRLCGYPLEASVNKTSALLDGAAAKSIITELNSASATRISGKECPAHIGGPAGTIELIGIFVALQYHLSSADHG